MATDLLNIATSGIRAARAGLDTTAQNIANAGTKGYIRRTISLAELASPSSYAQVSDLSFSGVTIGGYSRNVDAFRQAEVRRTGADSARAATELDAFQNVESALEQSGLFPAMTAFETSLQHLSSDTTDPVLRTATLEAARTLSRTFNLASTALDTAGESLRFAASDGTGQVNRLARELGRTNLELSRATPGAADQIMLLDQRDNLLGQMTDYADITTSFGPNQTVQVRIGGSNGPLLVDGINVDPVVLSQAADYFLKLSEFIGRLIQCIHQRLVLIMTGMAGRQQRAAFAVFIGAALLAHRRGRRDFHEAVLQLLQLTSLTSEQRSSLDQIRVQHLLEGQHLLRTLKYLKQDLEYLALRSLE